MVLDIPIWLDTLICQLLEKQPDKRPLDANTVAATLSSIKEKVEAQQSAGVDAVRRRLVDRTAGQKRIEEEDKDAARTLLTGKGRPKRKKTKKPLYEKLWFQAIGLALALSVVATFLYLAFRPPPPDKLYQQAKAIMELGDIEKQESAIEPNGVITKCINAYRGQDNEQSREVRSWKEQIQVAGNERMLDRHLQQVRENTLLARLKPEGKIQEEAFKAVDADEDGDRQTAIEHWQEVRKLDDTSWTRVADKHLAEWNAVDQIEDLFKKMYDRIRNTGEEPSLTDDTEREAFLAWRAEISEVGDRGLAKSLYRSLREKLAKEPGMRQRWYLFAAWRKRKWGDEATNKDQLKEKVHKHLNKVGEQQGKKIRKLDAKLVCQDVLALYDQDKEMEQVVKEAKKLLSEISK